MKKTPHIVIYRRTIFGNLVKVAAYCSRRFEARISTSGVLRINKVGERNDGLVAAFAQGEWSQCDGFTLDYSSEK